MSMVAGTLRRTDGDLTLVRVSTQWKVAPGHATRVRLRRATTANECRATGIL